MKIEFMSVSAMLLATLVGSASANITFTYKGGPIYENSSDYGNFGQLYDPINATLIVSDDGKHLIDWTISQTNLGTLKLGDMERIASENGKVFSYADENLMLPFGTTVSLQTDEQGNVNSWNFNVGVPVSPFAIDENGYWWGVSEKFIFAKDKDGSAVDSIRFDDSYGPDIWGLAHNSGGSWTSDGVISKMDLAVHTGYNGFDTGVNVSPVPEPETYAMMLLGLITVVTLSKYSRKSEDHVLA